MQVSCMDYMPASLKSVALQYFCFLMDLGFLCIIPLYREATKRWHVDNEAIRSFICSDLPSGQTLCRELGFGVQRAVLLHASGSEASLRPNKINPVLDLQSGYSDGNVDTFCKTYRDYFYQSFYV
ncbi:UNVERIFIED_CONTAM: hypothetical protein K2H54_001402 [Gekko kuhli]